ncbi:hypothetical protein HC762_01135 [bacterium]|nr:hypothetical protein [bacterium]
MTGAATFSVGRDTNLSSANLIRYDMPREMMDCVSFVKELGHADPGVDQQEENHLRLQYQGDMLT